MIGQISDPNLSAIRALTSLVDILTKAYHSERQFEGSKTWRKYPEIPCPNLHGSHGGRSEAITVSAVLMIRGPQATGASNMCSYNPCHRAPTSKKMAPKELWYRAPSELATQLVVPLPVNYIKEFCAQKLQNKRFGLIVFTVHDCWEQWSREGTASKRSVSWWVRGTTETKDCHIRRTTMANRTASATEIRAACCNIVTQLTFRNWLLQEKLQARCSVACIPMAPSYCRLRHQWCEEGLTGRQSGGLLYFLITAGSVFVLVMTVCWSERCKGKESSKRNVCSLETLNIYTWSYGLESICL
ncbi:HTH_Tnp_Tc3_2 domain-containing protein [Trichonephila clavipes]|nr:HTH_Tnp_Tc3_2 domain-containing protein [Trichonephila clavipes]